MIYLDNCATTKIRQEVLDKMYECMKEDYGNPSSLHRLGLRSEKQIKQSRELIAKYLRVDSGEIFFTSGGTESNNIAIQSIINNSNKKNKHIITTSIEHPSVLNIMKNYEKKGFKVTYLNVDRFGSIDIEELKESICEDTILVSIMHVNNEIGTIQDIGRINKIIKDKNSQTLLHVDGVQSFGKIEFSLKTLGVDTFSFSSHKVYGPKGVGGLYIRKGLNLNPIIFGGNQEKGLRSGTENLHGIIGFGEAVKILNTRHTKEAEYVGQLRKYMLNKIKDSIEDIKINTDIDGNTSPYILNISFRNTRGEVLLHYLEDKDIYVSTSSACSSRGTEKSHVLKSIGLHNKDIEGAIRICFSYENSREDIDYTVAILKDSVEEIRKIMMR
ncbi:cysteine desulfurase family protein [Wansuia hejianensis]|uniref:cysteine desulfurase family protein n=1 Tax=Wansuia hejianensis TaxID=2763667 RepID=UPI0024B5C367|nr:cysteine desulfurase family protein [Wansuia hejianensis]